MQSKQPLAMPLNRYAIEKYVEDASLLWLTREMAVAQPCYFKADIDAMDSRLESNLQSLYTAPEEVWAVCERKLQQLQPGYVFTSAIVAFRSLEASKIQSIVTFAIEREQVVQELVSAIVWLPAHVSELWVQKLLRSKDFAHKWLALCVMRAQQRNPGSLLEVILQRDDCYDHEKLHSEALRLVGELKLHQYLPYINLASNYRRESSEEIWFWSRWALFLLGDDSELEEIEAYILQGGQFQEEAIRVYFRVAPISRAKAVIAQLVKSRASIRCAIRSSMILGDPHIIPWLLAIMSQSEFARVAGEAFSHITGIDLEAHQLHIALPSLSAALDPREDYTDLDKDETLPWPDREKIKAVWQKYGSQFKMGIRYFNGKMVKDCIFTDVLQSGDQRSRLWASYELALGEGKYRLINVAARATQ